LKLKGILKFGGIQTEFTRRHKMSQFCKNFIRSLESGKKLFRAKGSLVLGI